MYIIYIAKGFQRKWPQCLNIERKAFGVKLIIISIVILLLLLHVCLSSTFWVGLI